MNSNPLIYSVGTQVVTLKDVYAQNNRVAHPAGAVGVIVQSPVDRSHAYRVKFADSFESPIHHDQLTRLADFKREQIGSTDSPINEATLRSGHLSLCDWLARYGLEGDESDTDRRGVYLPSAEMHWSLYGVPEQLENEATQEMLLGTAEIPAVGAESQPQRAGVPCTRQSWKLITPLGEELLQLRQSFLSKLVFQTYSGYVASQFKKMQADIRNHGTVKWKHVMHLIRLLMSGITVLKERQVMVEVGEHRERLLAIKRGEVPFEETNQWRKELQREFEGAFERTDLPERPDYERINEFLIRARRLAVHGESTT